MEDGLSYSYHLLIRINEFCQLTRRLPALRCWQGLTPFNTYILNILCHSDLVNLYVGRARVVSILSICDCLVLHVNSRSALGLCLIKWHSLLAEF